MGSAITQSTDNSDSEPENTYSDDFSRFGSLDDIIDDNERVNTVLVSDSGLTRVGGDGHNEVEFAVGMVVTDRRILFAAVDSEMMGDTGTLPYAELAAVTVDEGSLELATTDGVVWQFPVADADDESVGSALRHLRWIGQVRSRLVSIRNDVEMVAGEIRAQAAEMNWEQARETYEQTREQLDDLICTVQCTAPLEDAVLAPDLATTERTLEGAHTRLYIERARSQLELGRHLVRNEDYDQASKVLEQAQEYYESAREWREVIKRGDSFQFGTQRDLQNDLEDLGWEIETVAAEPIRQAHEQKILAQNADDEEQAVEHWEGAFRRYGNVLTLEWGDSERNFAGDPQQVREEMRYAATHLIDNHETVARSKWNEGAKMEQNGALGAAVQRCKSATDHLERAHELAGEFDPARADTIASRLQTMFEALIEMRASAVEGPAETTDNPEESTDEDSEAETTGETPDQPSETEDEWPPSLGDLSEIDTHQEITLEVDGLSSEASDSKSGRSQQKTDQEEEDHPDQAGEREQATSTRRE